MNVTLVAWYGDQPTAVAAWIEATQACLTSLVPGFVPYRPAQVHATIVGLEGRREASGEIVSANFEALRGERRRLEIGALLERLSRGPLPMPIRIGGYAADGSPPFLSRGRHPYERSFFFAGDTAVAIGWPRDPARPQPLGRWRRELETAGALHKYHLTPDDLDDDLFFVLGRVRRAEIREDALARVTREVRERMADSPIEVVLAARALYLAGYVDPTLPVESTFRTSAIGADEALVRSLYRAPERRP
jgi:hypothetical protein